MSELVGSVFIGLADIITDGIACARLLHGDVVVPNEGYKTAYVAVLCFALVTTVISIAYRFHNARAMRAQVIKLSEQQGRTAKSSAARRQAQNEWELAQTHRTKIILSLALLSAAAQGLLPAASCIYGPSSCGASLRRDSTQQQPCAGVPMSILNCSLIFIHGVNDNTVCFFPALEGAQRLAEKLHKCELGVGQVLASLLVSVLLVGIKVTAAKEIVQIIERRKELKTNLALLQKVLQVEAKKSWIEDVTHDTKQQREMIAELGSASGLSYSHTEEALVKKGDAMLAVFEASSAGAKQYRHSALITCSETKLDAATGLLLGRAVVSIRARPQEIVAHLLDYDSRFNQSTTDPAVYVRSEAVEHVNAHHTTSFNRLKLGPGLSHRTFLNSTVAKRVADDPPTYVVVGLPIARHEKITPKDEKGAVRAENCRAFKLTEVAEGITRMEYACSLNLGGSIPQAITNKVSVPGQMHGAPLSWSPAHFHSSPDWALVDTFAVRCAVPTTLRRYFQHVWPIEDCGAEDGRVVGRMLHDLVSSKPKDLDHAICEFVDRTAMLRDCGLAHIGDMLARLLRNDVHGKPGDGTVAISPAPVPPRAVGLDPSALTEEHAVAIGSAIVASVHEASAPVAGLKTVVKSHEILQVMKSEYAWFVPMLEVLVEPNVASDTDAADEESGFSSVVRLGSESALMPPPPSPPLHPCR